MDPPVIVFSQTPAQSCRNRRLSPTEGADGTSAAEMTLAPRAPCLHGPFSPPPAAAPARTCLSAGCRYERTNGAPCGRSRRPSFELSEGPYGEESRPAGADCTGQGSGERDREQARGAARVQRNRYQEWAAHPPRGLRIRAHPRPEKRLDHSREAQAGR